MNDEGLRPVDVTKSEEIKNLLNSRGGSTNENGRSSEKERNEREKLIESGI